MLHHGLAADRQSLGELGRGQRDRAGPRARAPRAGSDRRARRRRGRRTSSHRANCRVTQWRSRSKRRSSHIAPSGRRRLPPATDARVSVTATLVPCSTGVSSNTTRLVHALVGVPPHEREPLAFAHVLDHRVPHGPVRLDVGRGTSWPKIEAQRCAEPCRELVGIGEQVPGLVSVGVQDDFTFHVHRRQHSATLQLHNPMAHVQLYGCTSTDPRARGPPHVDSDRHRADQPR